MNIALLIATKFLVVHSRCNGIDVLFKALLLKGQYRCWCRPNSSRPAWCTSVHVAICHDRACLHQEFSSTMYTLQEYQVVAIHPNQEENIMGT